MSQAQLRREFNDRTRQALRDGTLQAALKQSGAGFLGKRARAVGEVGDVQWQQWREQARALKDHTLLYLDHYLLEYERQVQAAGGHVHWAADAAEARRIISDLAQRHQVRRVVKGKSMVSEEVDLNAALSEADCEVVETDLGEYIVQLAGERPSHIIAPACHKTRAQVADLFHAEHGGPKHTERRELVDEARRVLRQKFLQADMGITGANFLVASTGQHVLVTNEGNGDLVSTLPRLRVVITGIEKVVPTCEDAAMLLRLLPRSATGQRAANYTSFYGADDGREDSEFHVVLLDNGRARMLGGSFREMLRCFRCGACLNHCPVYASIGGHGYDSVYPGPMGSVLTPNFIGIDRAGALPGACTLNGRCGDVCPMKIPLPNLLRKLRERQQTQGRGSMLQRLGMASWSRLNRWPWLYRPLGRVAARALHVLPEAVWAHLPVLRHWADTRSVPRGEGETFMAQWQRHRPQGRKGKTS